MRSQISIHFNGDHVITILLIIDQQLNLKLLHDKFPQRCRKNPFPTIHINISFVTLYVLDKTDVIDRNVNVNATESRNQNISAEVEILTKNDLIQNQDPSKKQVHIIEDGTKCNVAKEENNEIANKDKDTLEKVSYIPHFIEEKQTNSLLPNIDTKGDQLCLFMYGVQIDITKKQNILTQTNRNIYFQLPNNDIVVFY